MSAHPSDPIDHARGAAAKAANSTWFEYVARVGYVMAGLVHAMIGWICLRLGLSGSGGESADQSGALAEFAQAPAGAILLIIGGIAMAALAVTHILDIVFGRARGEIADSAKALGKASAYAALAFTAFRFGTGDPSSSGDSAESMTAPLLGSGPGRAVVIVVGLIIVAIGIYHIYKGVTRKFRQDLNPAGDHTVNRVIDKTGLVGYVAKGAALAGVGIMVMWASISADSDKARGLDAAFKQVLDLPAGGILLAAIGIGFILYGAYSVLRAKYQEM